MAFKQLEPRITTYSVGDFLNWASSDGLDLTPSFQRRKVWRKPAKSYLIDTILRGLPIPIIFLREVTRLEELRTIRQVVDGQQRLHTLFSYIQPAKIKGFIEDTDAFTILRSHNKVLSGSTFADLSQELKQRIIDYEFSVHVLPSDTSDRDVLEIFRRMNSTGTPLNAQELRNAEFNGEFASFVSHSALQQLERWRSWGVFSEDQIARMREVEMTADLYNLMINGISSRTKFALDKLYTNNDEEFSSGDVLSRRFLQVFDEIDRHLGRDIVNLGIKRPTPFYAIFAVFYDFCYGLESPLIRTKARPVPKKTGDTLRQIDKIIGANRLPQKVEESLSRRTTHIGNRLTYVHYFLEKVRDGVTS